MNSKFIKIFLGPLSLICLCYAQESLNNPCKAVDFQSEEKYQENPERCNCGGKGECRENTRCVHMKSDSKDKKSDVCRSIQDKKIIVKACKDSDLDISGRPKNDFCNCGYKQKVCPKRQFCLIFLNGTDVCVGDFKVDPDMLGKELKQPDCQTNLNNKNCNCKGNGPCPPDSICSLSTDRICQGKKSLPSCSVVAVDDLNRPAELCDCGPFGVCPMNMYCSDSYTCLMDFNFSAWVDQNRKKIEN